jgi:threonylcarbamoyladenosine tRNA methylthiotransferase MtaB
MNRPADITQSVIERLVQFRKSFPHAACGADIIVGFPGESDSFFNETCNHIDRIGLTYAHVFRFSSRPETPAAIMGNQVEEAVKTKRSTQLRKIVAVHRNKFLHQLQHTTQRIIVESSNPVRGITSNFVHVEIPDCVLEPNTWLDVSLTGKTCNRYCSAQPVISKVA